LADYVKALIRQQCRSRYTAILAPTCGIPRLRAFKRFSLFPTPLAPHDGQDQRGQRPASGLLRSGPVRLLHPASFVRAGARVRGVSSPPRSPASSQASSGPSPGACRRRRADRDKRVIASKGGASEPTDMLLPGTAAVRRILVSTICRIVDPTLVDRPRQLHDASAVMRFQPAHQSMINRRYDGACFARQVYNQCLKESHKFTRPLLAKADMRAVRI
jgi:hypothetical protein